MDDDFLPRSVSERKIHESHETSADSEGAYTFIIHGGQKGKKKKQKRSPGPPVNVKISSKALDGTSGNQENTNEEKPALSETNDNDDNQGGESSHRIDITV